MSSELGLEVLLAVLEKEESGTCEGNWDDHRGYYDRYRGWDDGESEEDEEEDWHYMDEVLDTSHNFKRIVDLNGRQLLSNVSTDEDFERVLQQFDPFDDPNDQKEDYVGFMGNWVG